ncbi:MAG: glycosyltransferase, partial [Acidobacteriota bacterium]|nr:glycosyltransferase [Acidobacteriota bacterium]
QGHEVRSMEQLVAPMAQMPELIACPRELDLPGIERTGPVAHIEPCIRAAETPDASFPWDQLPSDKELVLVSLGSQTEVYLEPARQLYCKLFEMMRAAADEPWHFVISVGKDFDPAELGATVGGETPDNVTICRWLPQLQLLDRAALMVGHGGLGTIKECAYFGVPMVIVPLSRDQPDNARRVEHHGFGLALDPATASVETLLEAVRRGLEDGDMAASARRLKEVFRRAEDEQRGAVLLEGILSGERPMVAAVAASESLAPGFAG